MIRTVIYLDPKDSNYEGVVDYFKGENVLEHSSEVDGFICAELFKPLGDGPMMVTATWESPDAYQRWLDHPWRAESNVRINKVLADDIEVTKSGDVYTLIHQVKK